MPTTLPTVLTIAGSDSGGGAGIQADLKTFEANDAFGTSVITALTAQNTQGVAAIHHVPPEMIQAQLKALFDDMTVQAIKIGMLGNAATIRTISEFLKAKSPAAPIVLDPVMVATSGDRLLVAEAETSLQQELMPLASVITPNRYEAQLLSGRNIASLPDAREAARTLAQRYPNACIILKGVNLEAEQDSQGNVLARDILCYGDRFETIDAVWVDIGTLHGTGCTFSSALAAQLAHGHPLSAAAHAAKAYISAAIRYAPEPVGQGSRVLRHSVTPVQL
jgi:hydroxymethylpyrimidine/phosphomethylpyrimidine kinase